MIIITDTLEQQGMSLQGAAMADATTIHTCPRLRTRNEERKRNPEMQQIGKGKHWHIDMTADVWVPPPQFRAPAYPFDDAGQLLGHQPVATWGARG